MKNVDFSKYIKGYTRVPESWLKDLFTVEKELLENEIVKRITFEQSNEDSKKNLVTVNIFHTNNDKS